MQMQEVFNFHTITNNTPSTTGSISSTSNQCAWWAVQASWPGMVWFLMSVRPSLLLLLPFSLPPPVSQNPRTSTPLLPPVMVTDPSGTAYPCILEQLFGSSASVALRAKDERGSRKTSFFPCFSPSIQHNTKLISPPVFCFSIPLKINIYLHLLLWLWQVTSTPADLTLCVYSESKTRRLKKYTKKHHDFYPCLITVMSKVNKIRLKKTLTA